MDAPRVPESSSSITPRTLVTLSSNSMATIGRVVSLKSVKIVSPMLPLEADMVVDLEVAVAIEVGTMADTVAVAADLVVVEDTKVVAMVDVVVIKAAEDTKVAVVEDMTKVEHQTLSKHQIPSQTSQSVVENAIRSSTFETYVH